MGTKAVSGVPRIPLVGVVEMGVERVDDPMGPMELIVLRLFKDEF